MQPRGNQSGETRGARDADGEKTVWAPAAGVGRARTGMSGPFAKNVKRAMKKGEKKNCVQNFAKSQPTDEKNVSPDRQNGGRTAAERRQNGGRTVRERVAAKPRARDLTIGSRDVGIT